MPWRECSVTEERLRFVARLLEGEALSEVCREFGISRVRHEIVTHVLGTFCHPCLRVGHREKWSG